MPTRIQYDFRDHNVVVTGGARGQGLSHAIAFAEAGARVVIVDHVRANGGELQYSLASERDMIGAMERIEVVQSAKAIAINADVSEPAAVEAMTRTITQNVAMVDVVVNNAGINVVKTVEEMSVAEWELLLNVNLKGPFLVVKNLLPVLRQPGASIINIASLAALKGVPQQAAYAASKAGLLGLTRSMAAEFSPLGIRVNAVCPSIVASPQSIGLRRAARGGRVGTPTGLFPGVPRFGAWKPQDITNAVMWLASEAAGMVSGQVFVIDAGK